MEWSETPKHQNKVAPSLAGMLFAVAAVLWLVSAALPIPALWQLLAIAAFCAAICLVARHQEHYTYHLEPDSRGGEGTDLVIRQVRHKLPITVCRLDVADVREIDVQTSDNADALKKKYANTQTRVHNYCVDVLPPYSVYVRFDDGGNRVVIRLQPSDHLLEVLRSACP